MSKWRATKFGFSESLIWNWKLSRKGAAKSGNFPHPYVLNGATLLPTEATGETNNGSLGDGLWHAIG